jgi:hypothetical protein
LARESAYGIRESDSYPKKSGKKWQNSLQTGGGQKWPQIKYAFFERPAIGAGEVEIDPTKTKTKPERNGTSREALPLDTKPNPHLKNRTMKKRNITLFTAIAAAAAFASSAQAATIKVQNFDSLTTTTTSHTSGGGTDWGFGAATTDGVTVSVADSTVVTANTASNQLYFDSLGSGTGTSTLTWDAVDISGYTNVVVSLWWTTNGPRDAFEPDDFLKATVTHDAAGSPDEFLNAIGGSPTDPLDANAGYVTASTSIPDSATTFTLTINTDVSGGDENIWLDSFSVTGVPEPATMSLLAIGGLALLRRRRRS